MANPLLKNLFNDSVALRSLADLGVSDPNRALSNLRRIASVDMPVGILESVFSSIEKVSPNLSDSGRAINNLERLVGASPSVESDGLRNSKSIEALMNLLSTSQFFSDVLVRSVADLSQSWSSAWEDLWSSQGKFVGQAELIDGLTSKLEQAKSVAQAMKTIRQFKHLQFLRIGVCDLVSGQRVEQITSQISFVANAIVEASYRWARRDLVNKHGEPTTSSGLACRFVVLAMGKLGGRELNYSSDIDLVMLFDEAGATNADAEQPRISNLEFF